MVLLQEHVPFPCSDYLDRHLPPLTAEDIYVFATVYLPSTWLAKERPSSSVTDARPRFASGNLSSLHCDASYN